MNEPKTEYQVYLEWVERQNGYFGNDPITPFTEEEFENDLASQPQYADWAKVATQARSTSVGCLHVVVFYHQGRSALSRRGWCGSKSLAAGIHNSSTYPGHRGWYPRGTEFDAVREFIEDRERGRWVCRRCSERVDAWCASHPEFEGLALAAAGRLI